MILALLLIAVATLMLVAFNLILTAVLIGAIYRLEYALEDAAKLIAELRQIAEKMRRP